VPLDSLEYQENREPLVVRVDLDYQDYQVNRDLPDHKVQRVILETLVYLIFLLVSDLLVLPEQKVQQEKQGLLVKTERRVQRVILVQMVQMVYQEQQDHKGQQDHKARRDLLVQMVLLEQMELMLNHLRLRSISRL
jgi:hypothetical protein